MNLTKTYYALCRRFPGGITAIANLMDMSADVLQKKLSPTCDTHHLNVDEAEAIDLITKDHAGAVEHARLNGYACIPMPDANAEGSLHKGMAEIGREFSELMQEFAEATKDNMISPNEVERFKREAVELFAACMAEVGRMETLANTRAPVIPIRGGNAA